MAIYLLIKESADERYGYTFPFIESMCNILSHFRNKFLRMWRGIQRITAEEPGNKEERDKVKETMRKCLGSIILSPYSLSCSSLPQSLQLKVLIDINFIQKCQAG